MQPESLSIDDAFALVMKHELSVGAENMAAMFRDAMWRAARERDESQQAARARLAADEGTKRTADMLGKSVEQLLRTFGQPQQMEVHAGFDERISNEMMREVYARFGALFDLLARDSLHKGGAQLTAAVKRAPRAGAERAQIYGDLATVSLLQNVLTKNRLPLRRSK